MQHQWCDWTLLAHCCLSLFPRATSNKGRTYHVLPPAATTTTTITAHREKGEPTTVEK